MAMPQMPKWYDDDGQIVSCTEKVKVMTENLNELYQIAQDAFEDALLMGCSEKQLREYLQALIEGVENPISESLVDNIFPTTVWLLPCRFLWTVKQQGRLKAAICFQTTFFCLPKSEPVSCNARKLYDIYQDYANTETVKFFQFVNSLLE